jgi:hypothetical protein
MQVLDGKSFTSKKQDLTTVAKLYKYAFEARFDLVEALYYTGLEWG